MPRRFRNGLNVSEITAIVIGSIVLLRLLVDFFAHDPLANRFEKFHEGPVEVVRVINGDTIRIRQMDRNEKQSSEPRTYEINLKLIGVEASDEEAAKFTEQFLSQGETRLRLDKRRRDHEGRLLGYIYVNHELLNLELVRGGLANATRYPGDNQSIARRLRRAGGGAEEYARR